MQRFLEDKDSFCGVFKPQPATQHCGPEFLYSELMHMVVCSLYYDSFSKIGLKKSQYITLLTVSSCWVSFKWPALEPSAVSLSSLL